MATALIVVGGGFTQTNDQRTQKFYGTLTIGNPGDSYIPGGLPLKLALASALMPNTNRDPIRIKVDGANMGYIYQYIPSTGKLMILEVPPSGSLTTQAPLQELNAGDTLSAVQADAISFEATYLRNAS